MKDVVYMTADAWDEISSLSFSKSCLKILGRTVQKVDETSDDNAKEETCGVLIKQLDGNLTDEDVQSWMSADSGHPGYLLMTDENIIEGNKSSSLQRLMKVTVTMRVIMHVLTSLRVDRSWKCYRNV